ncbi:MAG: hypothetical protein EXR79_01210 [Myxococcales bacterium]|nr:hypothetical protein [Myxococcales bacterium]
MTDPGWLPGHLPAHRPRAAPLSAICAVAVLVAVCAAAQPARADTQNFDLSARIYSKHLYQNDANQGLLMLGNPFWPDDVAGHNGVGSELELSIRGRVSPQVETGARIASRFGERWHDWWESGNSLYDGKLNTSGDSAGLNRAAYLKLRGTYIQVAPEAAGIDWVRVGASDLAMFNPWTIGKVRYIDRDNGRGYFAAGRFGADDAWQWHAAAIALPKLWVGPWWSTGVGDPALANAFWSRDWAYAGSLRWRVGEATTVRLVGDATQDLEVDVADPDAVGSKNATCKDALGNPIAGCAPDHAVDLYTRYASANATVDFDSQPLDWLRVQGLVGVSWQQIDPKLTANAVQRNQGLSPIAYRDGGDVATTLRVGAQDPWEVGLSLQGEYFNVGADWNSIFGARRESDVLLTEGLVGGGGQLPTLNLANEFLDFDEDWVETCIGWHGGTALATYEHGDARLHLEVTHIEYNTNRQDRDVAQVYPDFLHGDGFTDIALYDYANVTDRGRDPRSAFRKNQYRRTDIAVLRGRHLIDVGRGIELEWKAKAIHDVDYRRLVGPGATKDDYDGTIVQLRGHVAVPVADGVKLGAFTQGEQWDEQNRRGTLELGYGDDTTWKWTAGVKATVMYAGIKANWHLEHIAKAQDREREPDQAWSVWRSKLTVEAAW